MVAPLGSVQPVFTLPPIDEVPDNIEDKPADGEPLNMLGPLELPELIFGAGNLSNQYNSDDHLTGTAPVRTIRLCLRYGIRAFDTSAYYGPSEIVLGTALKAMELEFPRSSYKLMTKCGRYGMDPLKDFDYSPSTIRRSVERSVLRLNTSYLDTVYLHDVEYVSNALMPKMDGNHVLALTEEREAYGLAEGQEGKVLGEGDQKVLDGFMELRKMKDEGLIKNIGITGYQLPTLLRLALLILHSPPYTAVDVILSYSHLSIQNDTFKDFLPHFTGRAKVRQVVTASPLSMGLLTLKPPAWHPAPASVKAACSDAKNICVGWDGGLPNIALGYAYGVAKELGVATVAGFGVPGEVHETLKVWRELSKGDKAQQRKEYEARVIKVLEEKKSKDFSWKSP